MPPPFSVRDQDNPGRDLGEWTEGGGIRLPGDLTVEGTANLTQLVLSSAIQVLNATSIVASTINATSIGASTISASSGLTVTAGVGSAPFAIKPGDTSRNTVTVPADDPDLQVAVEANSTYLVEAYLCMSSTSETPDFKMNAAGPAGGTHSYTVFGLALGTTSPIAGSLNAGAGFIIAALGVDDVTPTAALMRGTYRTGVTAGTYRIQWSQQVSDAANVTLKADSWLRLLRVV